MASSIDKLAKASAITSAKASAARVKADKQADNYRANSAAGKNAKVAEQIAKQSAQVLDVAMLKLGKQVWGAWKQGKLYVALGIREKTATGTGTRAAMLATAAFGYTQGQGRVIAMAVRAAMGLNPNVGGIDFPWLEKASNIATITSSAAIRPDAKDGKMRLLPIVATRKAKVSPEVAAIKARKASAGKVRKATANGPVTESRMSDAELAKLQAESDGASS